MLFRAGGGFFSGAFRFVLSSIGAPSLDLAAEAVQVGVLDGHKESGDVERVVAGTVLSALKGKTHAAQLVFQADVAEVAGVDGVQHRDVQLLGPEGTGLAVERTLPVDGFAVVSGIRDEQAVLAAVLLGEATNCFLEGHALLFQSRFCPTGQLRAERANAGHGGDDRHAVRLEDAHGGEVDDSQTNLDDFLALVCRELVFRIAGELKVDDICDVIFHSGTFGLM